MNKLWFYDCDMGQGSVAAKDAVEARAKAIRDAGRSNGVSNVHEASRSEVEFRLAMGGSIS